MRAVLAALLLVGCAACGREVLPPGARSAADSEADDPGDATAGEATADTAEGDAAEAGAEDAARGGDDDPATDAPSYGLVWSRQGKPLVDGLAITNEHAVVLSEAHLSVYALANGELLARQDFCAGEPGWLAAAGASLTVVCGQAVTIHELPSLTVTATNALPEPPTHVAIAGQRSVVVSGDQLRSYDDWRLEAEMALPAKPNALTIARTKSAERLAVALEDGTLLTMDAAGRAPARITVHNQVDALAFSPAGHLFVAAGPQVRVWNGPATVQRFIGLEPVDGARWLDDRHILAHGISGLLLLDAQTAVVTSLGGGLRRDVPAWVAAVGDALCSVDQAGAVTCYARDRRPGERELPMTATPERRMTGRVIAKQDSLLRIQVAGRDVAPDPETQVRITRYTEIATEGGTSARWIPIGEGRVVSSGGGAVAVRLEAGVKPIAGHDDPLGEGAAVQLVW